MDDIDAVSSYDKTTYSTSNGTYGQQHTTSIRYPNIFANEVSGLDRSKQDGYITGSTSTNSLTFKSTYYEYENSATYFPSIYLELFKYEVGSTTDDFRSYWLASRYVEYYKSGFYREGAYFGLFAVNTGIVRRKYWWRMVI